MNCQSEASLEERVTVAIEAALRMGGDAVNSAREFLASEQGRELRHKVAVSVIWAAPLFGEMPLIRKTPVGRILRVAGVTAILIKGAERLRDWQPSTA